MADTLLGPASGPRSLSTVSSADLRAVLVFVERLLEVSSFAAVETVLLPGLADLLSSDMAAYHHVNLRPDALVEHVYAKLGVDNRIAALRVLGGSDS